MVWKHKRLNSWEGGRSMRASEHERLKVWEVASKHERLRANVWGWEQMYEVASKCMRLRASIWGRKNERACTSKIFISCMWIALKEHMRLCIKAKRCPHSLSSVHENCALHALVNALALSQVIDMRINDCYVLYLLYMLFYASEPWRMCDIDPHPSALLMHRQIRHR